jgi:hypothetical protein
MSHSKDRSDKIKKEYDDEEEDPNTYDIQEESSSSEEESSSSEEESSSSEEEVVHFGGKSVLDQEFPPMNNWKEIRERDEARWRKQENVSRQRKIDLEAKKAAADAEQKKKAAADAEQKKIEKAKKKKEQAEKKKEQAEKSKAAAEAERKKRQQAEIEKKEKQEKEERDRQEKIKEIHSRKKKAWTEGDRTDVPNVVVPNEKPDVKANYVAARETAFYGYYVDSNQVQPYVPWWNKTTYQVIDGKKTRIPDPERNGKGYEDLQPLMEGEWENYKKKTDSKGNILYEIEGFGFKFNTKYNVVFEQLTPMERHHRDRKQRLWDEIADLQRNLAEYEKEKKHTPTLTGEPKYQMMNDDGETYDMLEGTEMELIRTDIMLSSHDNDLPVLNKQYYNTLIREKTLIAERPDNDIEDTDFNQTFDAATAEHLKGQLSQKLSQKELERNHTTFSSLLQYLQRIMQFHHKNGGCESLVAGIRHILYKNKKAILEFAKSFSGKYYPTPVPPSKYYVNGFVSPMEKSSLEYATELLTLLVPSKSQLPVDNIIREGIIEDIPLDELLEWAEAINILVLAHAELGKEKEIPNNMLVDFDTPEFKNKIHEAYAYCQKRKKEHIEYMEEQKKKKEQRALEDRKYWDKDYNFAAEPWIRGAAVNWSNQEDRDLFMRMIVQCFMNSNVFPRGDDTRTPVTDPGVAMEVISNIQLAFENYKITLDYDMRTQKAWTEDGTRKPVDSKELVKIFIQLFIANAVTRVQTPNLEQPKTFIHCKTFGDFFDKFHEKYIEYCTRNYFIPAPIPKMSKDVEKTLNSCLVFSTSFDNDETDLQDPVQLLLKAITKYKPDWKSARKRNNAYKLEADGLRIEKDAEGKIPATKDTSKGICDYQLNRDILKDTAKLDEIFQHMEHSIDRERVPVPDIFNENSAQAKEEWNNYVRLVGNSYANKKKDEQEAKLPVSTAKTNLRLMAGEAEKQALLIEEKEERLAIKEKERKKDPNNNNNDNSKKKKRKNDPNNNNNDESKKKKKSQE